jgi:pectinesterase
MNHRDHSEGKDHMMRKSASALVGIAFLIALCPAQQKHLIVKVTNPSDLARENETISVPWDTLKAALSLGKSESMVVKETASGDKLMSQWIDDDLGGIPEELIFQSSFKPRESKWFLVAVSPKSRQKSSPLVDVRYVEPREDLAWENDRIAFRVYGPALAAEVNNGIDVWTKRVRSLIVKKWYDGEEQTPKIVYHEDHGEGADFFDVGRSLGCGGSGIWHYGKLYQPGVFSSYKIISTGPIRASFELAYNKWNVEGGIYREVKRITLDAGQNLNRIEVTLKGNGEDDPLVLACGLVKRNDTKFYKNEENDWMSLWGKTTDDPINGDLGTGVVFQAKMVSGWAEDSSQYIVLGNTGPGLTFTYYAGAGWTRSGDFKSVEEWNGYLDRFAANLRLPLQVTFN